MTIQLADERRVVPRFNVWASCSLLSHLSDTDRRRHEVLGYVKDVSLEAVAVLLPVHDVYGINASSLGRLVELALNFPVGHIQVSATLIRHSPDDSGKHLAVFRIEESEHRQKYCEFVDSLGSE